MSEESKKLPTPPEVIYLIPGDFDGDPSWLWCEDTAPGQNDDPADAVKYYRHDYVELLEARNAEMEGWEKACKNESASRSKLQKLAVDCGEKLSEADAEIFKLQEREWISVSERLPDNIMEPVLVKHLNTVPMVAYYSKRKQWNRTGRSDITNDSIPTPIAWQPLPPTEDKK